ncbi:hypothetical_protein [Candidozyma auris]|uniref:farnesyltranstransferase n=1 Tax=Candidozyma auris TaxID=498019 RepID=UPI000D2E0EC9|nr:farnesyltranstransferase [[Candida] auris]QEO19252.1 hypothetical_protein [[Candida] auris]GBL50768.1 putative heptaprenyl diphosphate synthase component II [[Candida] auris]
MDSFSIDELTRESGPGEIPRALIEPYTYISNIPGNNQNMRYRFLVAFNEMFFKNDKKKILSEIGTIISIFHDSSLLIDDIEDSSDTRRGQECAHIKYGTPLTINCGNLMYFEALHRATNVLPNLEEHGSRDLSEISTKTNKILVDEMLNLHHGQGLDIYWRDVRLREWNLGKCELPSVEEYLRMVMNKTGGLFRLAVKLLALFTDNFSDAETDKLVPFSNLLGIIYQIRDDYMNLVDDRYSEMKGVRGEDLAEGKLSLPILFALQTAPCNSPLHTALFDYGSAKERLENSDKVVQALDYMRNETEALMLTYKLLKEYVAKALAYLKEAGAPSDALLVGVITHLGDVVKPSM